MKLYFISALTYKKDIHLYGMQFFAIQIKKMAKFRILRDAKYALIHGFFVIN